MKRLLTSLAIAIFAVTIMPVQALAANWAWTDVSDYVSNRTNRPIWAMAHANSGWFYTDGQNLWNGGQVYRFDGNTNVTITTDVRSAGLDRVDDIVSDNAGTVLFLKNTQAKNNTLEVVAYNGNYLNLTSQIRGQLYSNEGPAQIVGKNGTWAIVTTLGRVILYTPATNSFKNVRGTGPGYWDLQYSNTHVTTPLVHLDEIIQPLDNGTWLLGRFEEGTGAIFELVNSDGTISAISDQPSIDYIDIMATNGKEIFLAGIYGRGSTNVSIFDGTNFKNISFQASEVKNSSFNFNQVVSNKGGVQMIWTGKVWLIISNFSEQYITSKKVLWQYDGYTFQYLGELRDYFVTGASDQNNKILLGGAVSTLSLREPSNPLTAKLVMITEGGATTVTNTNTSSDTTVDTATGISKWEWIDPNMALSSTAQTTYHVGSWDADGIKRVDIYVNGTLKRTCELANAKGNTDCNLTIYGADYSIGTNIFVNAKITDAKDKAVWTSGLTIYRTTENSTTNTTTNSTSDSNSSIWTWIDPNKTSFNGGENVTFYAGAWDTDGINQIIMTVNGTDVRTCNLSNATGNVQCAVTVYANDYSVNSTITLRARIIDKNGVTKWSEQKSIYRNGTGTNNSNTNSNVWTWVEPNRTTIGSDESLTFSAGAWDTDGINRVILTVNGTDVRTCTFNSITGSVECSYQVYGEDYSANSTIALRARVIDKNGNTSWSNVQEIYRSSGTTSNNSNTSNSNATIWTWIEGNMTSIDPNESAIFNTGAWDGDGINQVVITVNGGDKKTCNFGAIKNNVECVYTVSANDYSANTNIVVRARVVDVNGNTTWSEERDIYRNAGSTSGNTNTDSSTGAISKWEWVEPSVTSLEIQKTAVYHADAWSASAIKSIVIYVNGTVSKTCNFNKSVMNRDCSVTITGRNYAQGSSVYMNALVTDYDGKQVWTTGKTLNITADSTSTQNNNANGWVSATTNREGGYSAGQTITISVNSDDSDGVARTEIYVNGTRTAICTNSKVCSTTVTPPSAGNYFNYAGTMVDKHGTVVTTGYKQITKK